MKLDEEPKSVEENLEKLNEIAKKYDALPIYAGLKETLDKVRLYCNPTPKAQKHCPSFVIATDFNVPRHRLWFWDKDGCWVCWDETPWIGTYEDAIKIAKIIGGVSIMTLECAKEIMSHYEEV